MYNENQTPVQFDLVSFLFVFFKKRGKRTNFETGPANLSTR